MPAFNSLTSLSLKADIITSPQNFFGLLILGILLGIISGIYPAFFISGFNPSEILKSGKAKVLKGNLLRKILIVVQFTISIAMIFGTIIVIQQLMYAKNKDLGYDEENLMVISINDTLTDRQIPAIKNELTAHSDIISVASSFEVPGETLNRFPASVEAENGEFQQISCQFMQIDFEYLETLKMVLLEGRNFERGSDTSWFQSALINKAAAEQFGWAESVGKRVEAFRDSNDVATYMNVIGVVEDFHTISVRDKIHPILIYVIPENNNICYGGNKRLFVRMKGKNFSKTVDYIKERWTEFDSNPIQYLFLDEELNVLYESEEKLIRLCGYFTFITIFIACLGLFGLAAFTAERRTKEIGVRKVLGSSVIRIAALLSKDFAILVLVSNVIALPIAYYVMNKWLQNFVYRIDISFWTFILSGLLALLIAIFTISFQTIRAANSNPIEALKYE
ncbi:MAG: hypothetical protein H8E57_06550 [Candidatus Cloacimonetes bacterium]|nr:hypothetical protein [Candidatus Cloacimonadota bacterium]